MTKLLLFALLMALATLNAQAQEWTGPVRGSWARTGAAQAGDVRLADAVIAVASNENRAVHQAARFLAEDLRRLTGRKPPVVTQPAAGRTSIILATLGNRDVPAEIPTARLQGQWEAYHILTRPGAVWLVGANFRGTAFAAYTLSERLGIDPLYHWTGYTPKVNATLALRPTNVYVPPPTFKYRGLFHDDEDILPRPFDPRNGYPYVRGVVPTEWYERFFETALRLRMNQVAPFVRVKRPFEIQQLASDWGLFYTSHHYDILLSNPYGYNHFDLARQRGVEGPYDYYVNREGMQKFWRAGVEENKNLEAIWPVGLRGTDDQPHRFPDGVTEDQKIRLFEEAIRYQVAATKEILPPGKEPIFHFTMYNEMLNAYQSGKLDIPEDVLIIWDDNGDGVMRGLPRERGRWKHGVYYHFAFFGPTAKQSVHTVTPMRVEEEFRKIVNAGATEYMLVNVSELREHVMETRFLAEITWDARTAFARPDAAGRFVDWWSREYFGAAAAPLAADAYRRYYQINDEHHKIFYASVRVRDAMSSLMRKMNGERFDAPLKETRDTLIQRDYMHREAYRVIGQAGAKMTPEQRQFFFEHVALGLLIDYRPTRAALLLLDALDAPDSTRTMQLITAALEPLAQLEREIRRAERPPFQGWYRPTWIRVADYYNGWSDMNVHRPYEMVRMFLEGRGVMVPPPASTPTAATRREDRALAERYSPVIRYDAREPFFPVKVGYTVFRTNGAASDAYPRNVVFATPDTRKVVEYAMYWDWDIQHAYELEHAWVHLDDKGKVTFVEATAHGGLFPAWPSDELVGGTHPVLYSEPGKHAFDRTVARYTAAERRPGMVAAATERAGSGGVLVVQEFRGLFAKEPGDDAGATAYLKGHAFTPSFSYTQEKGISPALLAPWPDVKAWIPKRLDSWRRGGWREPK